MSENKPTVKTTPLETAEQARAVLKAVKTQHDLHVLLIMQKLGLNKPHAEVAAWYEGEQGYRQRMGGLL